MQSKVVELCPDDTPERGRARRPRVVEQVLTRAMYLQTDPDPVFAMVHLPASVGNGATGVVLCPPYGWTDMCTYRTRRAWAEALAQSGHPAIRLDLPGTGDSAGSPRQPQRLAAWTAAVAAAARFLREETACDRVVGLGIGLGGILAWLAAAQGAPIDDLMLWAVPTKGRRLVREMRAAAMIEIDTTLEIEDAPSAGTEPEPDVDGLLDMAGRLMTQETVDALGRIDLRKVPLGDAKRRRVLLFEQDGVATESLLRDHLETCGAEITVASGEGYNAMMRYARYARIPRASIERSIEWLADAEHQLPPRSPEADESSSYRAPVQTLPSLALSQDGVAIRETAITVALESVNLFGILTEPVEGASTDVCAVLFNAGSDRRTGPSRAWVEAARRWAAMGVPTVRLDAPGVGDSGGQEVEYNDDFAEYYDPRITHRTVATMNALEAQGLPGRFVLAGFCAGGFWSFNAALADTRVAGAFAVNLPCFFTSWWTKNVVHGWWVYRQHRAHDPWYITSLLWTLKRVSAILPRARRVLLRPLRRAPSKLGQALNRLCEQDTELLLLFRPTEPLYEDLRGDGRIKRLDGRPNVHVGRIPGSDHTFRPLPLQRYVANELDAALKRVLDREARAESSEVRIAEPA